jgi:hypothetical protein
VHECEVRERVKLPGASCPEQPYVRSKASRPIAARNVPATSSRGTNRPQKKTARIEGEPKPGAVEAPVLPATSIGTVRKATPHKLVVELSGTMPPRMDVNLSLQVGDAWVPSGGGSVEAVEGNRATLTLGMIGGVAGFRVGQRVRLEWSVAQ